MLYCKDRLSNLPSIKKRGNAERIYRGMEDNVPVKVGSVITRKLYIRSDHDVFIFHPNHKTQ